MFIIWSLLGHAEVWQNGWMDRHGTAVAFGHRYIVLRPVYIDITQLNSMSSWVELNCVAINVPLDVSHKFPRIEVVRVKNSQILGPSILIYAKAKAIIFELVYSLASGSRMQKSQKRKLVVRLAVVTRRFRSIALAFLPCYTNDEFFYYCRGIVCNRPNSLPCM